VSVRVLVVEDSLTVRKHLVDLFNNTEGFEVVGEADNGKTAIELCLAHKPDVITMDMMLPVMTGVAATEYIMAYCPTPILIVSASTNRGELFRTYDALAAGAVDVLEKPDGTPGQEWEQELLTSVRLVSKIRVITHPRARLGRMGLEKITRPPPTEREFSVLAVGASTGGPGAVLTLLNALPSGYSLPVLLVIHISTSFSTALAEWLAAQTGRNVRFATDNEPLPARGVVLAPPGRHLELDGHRLRVSDAPERHSCKPSVDVLFESVARSAGAGAIGCLLTGMGKDGAKGLLDIRNAGGLTVAQDEKSSVVWGMPGEAVKIAAAQHVFALDEIGPFLRRTTEKA
jgi:two-component system, chemotaxis family, protein-glutamate methylesterase/glutaminase